MKHEIRYIPQSRYKPYKIRYIDAKSNINHTKFDICYTELDYNTKLGIQEK